MNNFELMDHLIYLNYYFDKKYKDELSITQEERTKAEQYCNRLAREFPEKTQFVNAINYLWSLKNEN